ncbi:MAG: PA0069 family radical SAM protein [Longimicrobiales bacterium]
MLEPTSLPVLRGRGASWNPHNRFERLQVELDPVDPDPDDEAPRPETEHLVDASRSILAYNDSPDVGFDAGINPYRGCSHGCSYCYARPTHEYLGFSAGLDFETKIMVKTQAPDLLRAALSSRSWKPQVIGLSGNTDAYQPSERTLGITRRCLEVLEEFRNPVAIVTKSRLVTRDVDLLARLADHRAVAVVLSVTTLRREVQRAMEPRAASPSKRLEAIRVLARAGIPVGVNVAPVVPGLTDDEVPAILEAAAEAGASFASYILLRLPWGVKDIFSTWLEQHFPERKDKILNRIRDLRGGKLYDARFEVRGKGEGPWADQLRALFRVTKRKLDLDRRPVLSTEAYRVPTPLSPQTDLFG